MTDSLVNLMDLDPDTLKDFVVAHGEKPFRATQLLKWIYQWGVVNFDEMTNIKKETRALLKEISYIHAPEIVSEQKSSDGTIKWAMDIGDGQLVETVFIPEKERNTLCISTQVGCPIKCAFCRTGKSGFNRNLKVSEIIGQVWRAASRVGFSQNQEQKPISNVVMMGMGEPLLNVQNVLSVVKLLLSDNAFALSKRRVTISTAGVVPTINKIAGKVDVAYCINESKKLPYSAIYNRFDATSERLMALDKPLVSRELLPGIIKRIIYNGYPLNATNLQGSLSDGAFRRLTQLAIWHYSDSFNVDESELTPQERWVYHWRVS